MSRIAAVGTVSGGALVSGAASVLGLAVATRALGTGRVGSLAVAWALAVVVGPGLWSSVEQEAARAMAAAEGTVAVGKLVGRRAAVAAAAVASAGLALRHSVFGGSAAVPLALAAVAAAYGPLHLAWGRLAGERRSRALAASVAVEGVARLVLVGGTAVVTHRAGGSAWALALAVAIAAVVGTVTATAPKRVGVGIGPGDSRAVAGRVRWLTWSGLLSQGLFLTAPALFAVLAPAGDTRTARLAMAVVLAHAPALAWKGVLAAVVPAVAAGGDRGPPAASAAVGRAAVTGAAIAAVAGVPVAVLLGDRVLDVLTGAGPPLGPAVLMCLAVATAAYLGALTATSALAGASRARAAAAAWLAGAVAAAVVVMLPGDALVRVAAALAVGTVVALAGVARACARPSSHHPAD